MVPTSAGAIGGGFGPTSPFGPTNLPGRQAFGPQVQAAHYFLAALTQHPVVQQALAIASGSPPPHDGQYADFRYANMQRFLHSPLPNGGHFAVAVRGH